MEAIENDDNIDETRFSLNFANLFEPAHCHFLQCSNKSIVEDSFSSDCRGTDLFTMTSSIPQTLIQISPRSIFEDTLNLAETENVTAYSELDFASQYGLNLTGGLPPHYAKRYNLVPKDSQTEMDRGSFYFKTKCDLRSKALFIRSRLFL